MAGTIAALVRQQSERGRRPARGNLSELTIGRFERAQLTPPPGLTPDTLHQALYSNTTRAHRTRQMMFISEHHLMACRHCR